MNCTLYFFHHHISIITFKFKLSLLSASQFRLDKLIMQWTYSRALNSKSSVGISSVTGRIVHGKDPTEPIIKERARRPVTEKLPTELF